MAKRSNGRRRGFSSDPTAPLGATRSAVRAATGTSAGWWKFPVVVGIIHWLIVQIPASLAYRYGEYFPPSPPFGQLPEPVSDPVGVLVNPMRQWDGLWYRLIADEGYEGHPAKAAFWPLFPWSMRWLGDLVNISYETAGYIIANICFIVALVLLYRLLTIDFDVRVAGTAIWAIALFPTALFFNAVYTESPFLVLLVGALLAARIQLWWLAGILAALAALTRSYGMFLILPMAVLYWEQYGTDIRRRPEPALAVAMPLLGPALFSWRLRDVQGNSLLWMDVQEQWNRYSARPWQTLKWAFSERSPENIRRGIRDGDGAEWGWLRDLIDSPGWDLITSQPWRESVANSDTLELVCTLLFIVLAIVGLRILPLYQTVYLLPGLIVPLFQPSSVHTLMSMPRFGLTLFPLFAVLGVLLNGRKITPFIGVLSAALLILLTIQFSTWYWVS
jgi:hypothetical protein